MRTLRIMMASGLTLALAACGGGNTDTTGTTSVANATSPAAAVPVSPSPVPTAAPTPAAKASVTKVETKDYDFAYSYPAEAAAIPALAASLDDDRAEVRAAVAKDAAAFRREMAEGDFPFRKYDSQVEWKRVANTPRFLSLSAETYDYTGGAHGSPGFRSLLWDRQAQGQLDVVDIFTSEAAIQSAIGAAFCDALDVQRAKRRGAPVVRGNGDSFNDCPKVSETTLILGSTNGRTFDRIGLLVGPYVAGAYAEGSYDLTLPVTPALLRAVKPQYRDAFATRG
ncbi:MAG TPA: DUF4163 domain-containing protein [Sphingomonas sp.]|nr:DUF4163 domain-containing protein [Sphingomonas sp.]